ncbi:MAG: hypothetical protein HKN19_02990 [Halioglobus sp.]|nr:hypothetical protein [Halioglobus sp.]
MDERHHMRQFLLYVFTLMIPCFSLWTVAGAPLAGPAIGFVNVVLGSWFPDIVYNFYVDGNRVLLMTQFGEEGGRLVPLSQAQYRLGFELNPRILSYSLPFYTCLHFATQKKEYLAGYLWGIIGLYVLMGVGLLALCMKELMIQVGKPFLEQPDVFVPNPNLIGLFYQLSVLIVPTLGPAAIWMWQSRESPLLKPSLERLRRQMATAEGK